MDEQYIEDEQKVGEGKNHFLKVIVGIVLILVIAFVALFQMNKMGENDTQQIEQEKTPVAEVTPTNEPTPEEEALSAFNELKAFEAVQSGETFTGPSLPPTPDANTPGLVSCFDYYSFGSVQVQLAPYRTEYSNADPILFGGEIHNENPYPVVNGQIYMKIFKLEQESEEFTKENGYPAIDFVLVKDGINIPANGSMPLEFEWNVPYNAAQGDYQAAFFFTTEYRYNLLGLSFTDDVTGNTAGFTVKREEEYNPVAFDKNSVRLNETRHSFALPPRHFQKEEEVTAYATLVNASDEPRTVDIIWDVYKWDGILDENKQTSEPQRVDIPANGEVEISYLSPVLDTAVTFLDVKVNDGDATSTLQIRFVRDGVGETRINYPSLFSYPLKAGEETTIFSCLHSTNEPVVKDNTLTLTLTDNKGKELHTYTYKGDVTGAMMGVKDTFTPKKDLTNLTLTAKLTNQGKTVEEVSIEYKCADIDPTLCSPEPQETEEPVVPNTDKDPLDPSTIIVVIIILLLLIGSGYFLTRKKTLTSDNQ